MSVVLNIIRAEHRSIRAVLHGMEYLLGEHDMSSGRLDLRVFRAMLYYLDTFSERMHHPKEDRYLFGALHGRSPEADKLIAELKREHAGGDQQLMQIADCLLLYEEGGDKEYVELADAVDRFVPGQWDHMRKEEDRLIPACRETSRAASHYSRSNKVEIGPVRRALPSLFGWKRGLNPGEESGEEFGK